MLSLQLEYWVNVNNVYDDYNETDSVLMKQKNVYYVGHQPPELPYTCITQLPTALSLLLCIMQMKTKFFDLEFLFIIYTEHFIYIDSSCIYTFTIHKHLLTCLHFNINTR